MNFFIDFFFLNLENVYQTYQHLTQNTSKKSSQDSEIENKETHCQSFNETEKNDFNNNIGLKDNKQRAIKLPSLSAQESAENGINCSKKDSNLQLKLPQIQQKGQQEQQRQNRLKNPPNVIKQIEIKQSAPSEKPIKSILNNRSRALVSSVVDLNKPPPVSSSSSTTSFKLSEFKREFKRSSFESAILGNKSFIDVMQEERKNEKTLGGLSFLNFKKSTSEQQLSFKHMPIEDLMTKVDAFFINFFLKT